MHQWVPEESMKSWAEARERFWEQYRAALPGNTGEAVEVWRKLREQQVAVWEKLVQDTLAGQGAWIERCFAQLASRPAPEGIAEFRSQFEQNMKQWLETQERLWNELFALIRGETPVALDAPVMAAEPVATEPAPLVAPEPVYEAPAIAEPVYAEPAPVEPVYEAPAPVEPVYEATAPVEPVYEAPAPVEPVYEAPATEPVYEAGTVADAEPAEAGDTTPKPATRSTRRRK